MTSAASTAAQLRKRALGRIGLSALWPASIRPSSTRLLSALRATMRTLIGSSPSSPGPNCAAASPIASALMSVASSSATATDQPGNSRIVSPPPLGESLCRRRGSVKGATFAAWMVLFGNFSIVAVDSGLRLALYLAGVDSEMGSRSVLFGGVRQGTRGGACYSDAGSGSLRIEAMMALNRAITSAGRGVPSSSVST